MTEEHNTHAHGTDSHSHTTHAAHASHEGEAGHTHGAPSHVSTTANAPASKAWAIGLVLVLLVAAVGFLIYERLNAPPAVDPNLENNRVQIKLLVDEQCTFCPQTNTIIAKFDISNVKYDLETIDAYSEEGMALAQEFDVNVVPAALISVKGLDQNAEVQFALQSIYRTKAGMVIFPESFLDGQPQTLTYLIPPTACVVEPGTIRIDTYTDYACPTCAAAHFVLERLQTDYNNVDVHITPVQYRRPTQATMDRALLNNKGAVCAGNLGYLDDYTECAYFRVQLSGTMDINEMKACLVESGGNSTATRNAFASCVQDVNKTAQNQLLENIRQSYLWRVPARWTPAYIFDCKYSFVGHNALPLFLCKTHPELEGCDAVIEQAMNPPAPDQNAPAEESPITIYVPDYNVSVVADANN